MGLAIYASWHDTTGGVASNNYKQEAGVDLVEMVIKPAMTVSCPHTGGYSLKNMEWEERKDGGQRASAGKVFGGGGGASIS